MFQLEWEFVWWKCRLQPQRGAPTHKGRERKLNNTLSQLLLELSSGSLQPHGKDKYVHKTHWNAGKSPLGLYESDYGIFRGVTKGRERKGLTRRDMEMAWLSGGEQGVSVCVSVEHVCDGLCGWLCVSVSYTGICLGTCWEDMLSLAAGWTWAHVAVAALPQLVSWAWYSLHTEEIPKFVSYNALHQTCKVHLL